MERLAKRFLPYARDIGDRRLDALDGMRVLFVFLVAWYHIWQQSWLSPSLNWFGQTVSLDFLPRSGYMLVDGMLLLSGLLLYYPVIREGGEPPKYLAFYKKRLVRIVPSYLLAVLVMLFFVALPEGKYSGPAAAAKDVLAHLTFTHTFFYETYVSTPLNGALWTLAIEMQFYLVFPLLARAYKKRPAVTFCLMTCTAFAYRAYAAGRPDTTLYINQLPAFLDVYALGFFAASAIAALKKRLSAETRLEKTFFTVCGVLCAALLIRLLQDQAASVGYEAIRLGQLTRRFSLALVLSGLMICVCFSLPAVRFVLGNRLMTFLSAISFQYYIWHQVFAVQLKKWGVPAAQSVEPWRAGERAWQGPYMLLCFFGALAIACAVTYLFERPLARLLTRRKTRLDSGASAKI